MTAAEVNTRAAAEELNPMITDLSREFCHIELQKSIGKGQTYLNDTCI